jgi:hypothetical protein
VVQLLGDIPAGLAGRPVLLVNDIIDTGRTVACAAAQLGQPGTRQCLDDQQAPLAGDADLRFGAVVEPSISDFSPSRPP